LSESRSRLWGYKESLLSFSALSYFPLLFFLFFFDLGSSFSHPPEAGSPHPPVNAIALVQYHPFKRILYHSNVFFPSGTSPAYRHLLSPCPPLRVQRGPRDSLQTPTGQTSRRPPDRKLVFGHFNFRPFPRCICASPYLNPRPSSLRLSGESMSSANGRSVPSPTSWSIASPEKSGLPLRSASCPVFPPPAFRLLQETALCSREAKGSSSLLGG